MITWGPSPQRPPQNHRRRSLLVGAGVVLAVILLVPNSPTANGLLFLIGFALVVWRVGRWARRRFSTLAELIGGAVKSPTAVGGPAAVLVGVSLGVDSRGVARRSRAEHAVLVIGPPRSGKTRGVIIPTICSHRGPVVSTSTKPDVLDQTVVVRARAGRVWQFDPTGKTRPAAGVEALRWSPLNGAVDWDGALLIARAMVDAASIGVGVTDGTHWSKRAQALLACVLHGAALAGARWRR